MPVPEESGEFPQDVIVSLKRVGVHDAGDVFPDFAVPIKAREPVEEGKVGFRFGPDGHQAP